MAKKPAAEQRPVRIVSFDPESGQQERIAEPTVIGEDLAATLEASLSGASEVDSGEPQIYSMIRYQVTEEDIRAKGKEYALLTFDTPENYERGRKAIQVCRETRSGIEKRRVQLKKESLEYGRRVDSAASTLATLIDEIEDPLKAKKKVVDDEKARVRAEKEAAEQRALEEKVRLEREAEEARLKAEREAAEAKLAQERASLEAERAELQKLREAADVERLAAEQRAAEATRLERERAEAEQAKLRAEQERIAAEQRAEQDRLNAEREKLEAERRAVQEQRERADREDFERQARIRAEEEAKAQADRERVAAEEARVAELERQAERKRRLEALKPDAQKLHDLARSLRGLPTPELASPEANEALRDAWHHIARGIEVMEDFGSERSVAAE